MGGASLSLTRQATVLHVPLPEDGPRVFTAHQAANCCTFQRLPRLCQIMQVYSLTDQEPRVNTCKPAASYCDH